MVSKRNFFGGGFACFITKKNTQIEKQVNTSWKLGKSIELQWKLQCKTERAGNSQLIRNIEHIELVSDRHKMLE